jgi:hypothetical protein
MHDDSEIIVGDKVDLFKEKGRHYKTMIEDIYEGGLYLVGVPSIGGIPMMIHVDDEISLVFYRESGIFIAPMKVAAFEKSGEVRYALLFLKGAPEREQRRGAFRLPVRVKVLICEQSDDAEKKPVAEVALAGAEGRLCSRQSPARISALQG